MMILIKQTWLIAVHVIFVVSWFAGLFYMVRLFIYHTEAEDKEEPERSILIKQFRIMEYRLWYAIATPAMVLTVVTGIAMLIIQPAYLELPWMHVKIAFVFGLLTYHFLCQRMMKRLASDVSNSTSVRLRFWNEVATVFLVAIVFLVVMKSAVDWIWGLAGLVGVSVLLMGAVRFLNRKRS